MIVAVCLLLTGALFGIYMFTRHLRRRALPKWATILHGAFGAAGFGVVLLFMVRTPGATFARDAVVILIAAIALGAVNLVFHLRRVRHRTVLIVLHALTAVAGVAMLGYGIIGGGPGGASEPLAPIASATPSASPLALGEVVAKAAPPPTIASTIGEPAPLPSTPAPSVTNAPPTPAVAALSPGPSWTDASVVFEGSSATLDAAARSALEEVVKDLQAHPEVSLVEVQGHADERGDGGLNIQLTNVRASAVVEFLVTQGVARSRLRGVGYGARCPADPECQKSPPPQSCHQAASWQRDRRVSLVIVEAAGQRFSGKVACDRGMSLAVRDRASR